MEDFPNKLKANAIQSREVTVIKTLIDEKKNPVFYVFINGKKSLLSMIEFRIKYPTDYARYFGSLLRFHK